MAVAVTIITPAAEIFVEVEPSTFIPSFTESNFDIPKPVTRDIYTGCKEANRNPGDDQDNPYVTGIYQLPDITYNAFVTCEKMS